jgi:hypothetical protein
MLEFGTLVYERNVAWEEKIGRPKKTCTVLVLYARQNRVRDVWESSPRAGLSVVPYVSVTRRWQNSSATSATSH